MVIASRTPEGEPTRCPVCGNDARIEPSLFFGDATCPCCGTLLWVLKLSNERTVFEQASSEHVKERVKQVLARLLGVSPDKLDGDTPLVNDLGADSLDIVELAMELEEELGR